MATRIKMGAWKLTMPNCVIVSGCDSGFGFSLAAKLDSLGVKTFAGCYTQEGVEKVKSKTILSSLLDVADEQSVEHFYGFVVSNLADNDEIQCLVNNAGIYGPVGMTDSLQLEDFVDCFRVNVFGYFLMVRAFSSHIRHSKGRIINMGSISGKLAVSSNPYCASKYAIQGFSAVLRREMRGHGVRVITINPTSFKTGLNANIGQQIISTFNKSPDRFKEEFGHDFGKKCVLKYKKAVESLSMKESAQEIVQTYIEAMFSKNPKNHYYPGGSKCKLLLAVSHCTTSVSDWLVSRMGIKFPWTDK